MEKRVSDLEKTIASLMEYIKGVNSSISEGFNKSNNNFDKITQHLKKIDGSIAIINAKIDSLDGSTNNNFGKVDVKLDDLKTEISKINNVTGYDELFQNLKRVS